MGIVVTRALLLGRRYLLSHGELEVSAQSVYMRLVVTVRYIPHHVAGAVLQ